MIAHDELVAGQGVQSVFELLGLGDGEVTRVLHPIELALQERLPGRFRQERKGLRQDKRNRRREQLIEHPDRRARRIFLDAEHRADP